MNVTGTVTDEPETSVSPVAKGVKATVVASTAAGIADVVRVVVYPSGAVTMTLNCSDPEAGTTEPSVYVSIDTECEAAVYVYEPIVPYAVDVPESTHDSAVVFISVVLVVVASYPVSVRTIELAFPVPHTADPAAVPYAAPNASVVIDASDALVVGPVNATTDDSPVGNV